MKQDEILVVEDNLDLLQLFASILEQESYVVHKAGNAEEAISVLSNISPDLILLDISMPEVSGFELSDILKKDYKYEFTPIIFISAHDKKEQLQKAFEHGAVDYISKPIFQPELIARVKNQLELFRLRKESIAKEKEIRNIIDNVADSIFIHDEQGKILEVNETFIKTFGYSKEELAFMNISNICIPQNFKSFEDDKKYIKQKGKIFFETKFIDKKGNEIQSEVLVNNIIFKNMNTYIGVSRDISEIKKIKFEKQQSETLFLHVLNAVDDMMSSKDINNRFTCSNNAFAKFYNYTADEIIGRTSEELVLKDEKLNNINDQDVLKTGKTKRFEKWVTKDGVQIFLDTIQSPIFDENGKIEGLVEVSRDLTKIKNIEQELILTKTQLEKAQSIAAIGSWELDVTGHEVILSNNLVRMLHVSEERIKYSDFFKQYVEKEDRKIIFSGHSQLLEGKIQTFDGEFKFINSKGNLLYFRLKSEFSRETQRLSGIVQDVTDEVIAKKGIEQGRKLFATIFEVLNDAIFLVDKKTKKIINANEAACNLLDLKKDRIIGESCKDYLCESVCASCELIDLGKKIIDKQINITNSSGKKIIAKKTVANFQIGGRDYMMERLTDITDIMNKEKELLNSNIELQGLHDRMLILNEEYEKSEEYSRSILNSISDMLFVMNIYGYFIDYHFPKNINDIIAVPEMFMGKHFSEVLPSSVSELIDKTIHGIFARKKEESIEFSLKVKKMDYWYSAKLSGIENKNNEFTGLTVIVRNITEQFAAENMLNEYKNDLEKRVYERTIDLRESEKKFRNIFDSSSDAIIITDLSGNYLEVNETACNRAEMGRAELMKLNLSYFDMRNKGIIINNYLNQIENLGKGFTATDYITKSGKRIYLELYGKKIEYMRSIALLHISRDITERKSAEREMLRTVIKTEEKERDRFSKEIHDGLGATLSAIKMYLPMLSTIDSEQEMDSFRKDMAELVNSATKTVKEIASNIRPHELNHFGLKRTLENFCERINKLEKVNVSLFADCLDTQHPEDIELIILRAVNELLNNTLKYADAKYVNIIITENDSKLYLDYLDDGNGFNVEELLLKSNRSGIGLSNIIDRARTTGGDAIFRSKPGEGMTAKLILEM